MNRTSLGCVLLELGLYQPLYKIDSGDYDDYDSSPEVFRARLLNLSEVLVGRMGSIYAGAVKDCLSIDIGTREEIDNEAQRTLCWKFAAALDQCMA